jgi:hypothetical protein
MLQQVGVGPTRGREGGVLLSQLQPSQAVLPIRCERLCIICQPELVVLSVVRQTGVHQWQWYTNDQHDQLTDRSLLQQLRTLLGIKQSSSIIMIAAHIAT